MTHNSEISTSSLLCAHRNETKRNKMTTEQVRSNNKDKSKNCRVWFASTATVKRSLHINDYSPQEKSAVWYSTEEMDRIRDSIFPAIHLMEIQEEGYKDDGDVPENGSICTRGLEFRVPQGAMRRLHNKRGAWDAVLALTRQYDASTYDGEEIAAAYKDFALPCQIAAQKMGLRDAEIAGICSSTTTKSSIHPEPTKRYKKSESAASLCCFPKAPAEPFSVRRFSRAA